MCNVCKYASLYGDEIHCNVTHGEVFGRCDNFKLDETLEIEMLKEENKRLEKLLDLKFSKFLELKEEAIRQLEKENVPLSEYAVKKRVLELIEKDSLEEAIKQGYMPNNYHSILNLLGKIKKDIP